MTTRPPLFWLFGCTLLGCGVPEAADHPDAGDAGTALVSVRIEATTAQFSHSDGLSGMTALVAGGGVRSLELMTGPLDPSPVTLLDLGVDAVEVGYDDGDVTEVAQVSAATFRPGRYRIARLVQAYSRYRIPATRHAGGGASPGQLDSVLVMSDQSRLDGVIRDAGYYRSVFVHPGGEIVTTGDDASIPVYSSTAGAEGIVEDGEWAVYFPIDLVIDEPPAEGDTLVVMVNMDHAFRWIDSLVAGYAPGVFDFTPSTLETVVRFGGNRFDLAWQ